MKQVQKKQAAEQSVYSYREQRYFNEKPNYRFRRPLLQIGGFFGFLILLWNLYAFSTYLMPDGEGIGWVSTKHQAVHNYLVSGSETEVEISNILNALIDGYESKSLTAFHIEEAQQKLFDLQKTLPLNNDRFAVMNHYYEQQFSFAYQITNVLKLENAPTVHQELTYIIGKQTDSSTARDSMLILLLKNEGMNYEIRSDGSISYEY